MKRFSVLFLLVFCMQSCQYFEKKVTSKDDLLKRELENINWSSVDEYPSTIACDSILDKKDRKICFFNSLTQKVQEKLASDSLKIYFKKADTLNLKVTIDANATMTFKTDDSEIKDDSKNLDSILDVHLKNITPVEPGIKRGIKVKTEFILPIILNPKNK